MTGIDSIKTTLEFLMTSANKVILIDGNGDGNVSIAEVIRTVTQISLDVPDLVSAIPNFMPEWKDITADERRELVEWFADKFDLPVAHDKLEAIIKRLIVWVNQTVDAYITLRAILQPA